MNGNKADDVRKHEDNQTKQPDAKKSPQSSNKTEAAEQQEKQKEENKNKTTKEIKGQERTGSLGQEAIQSTKDVDKVKKQETKESEKKKSVDQEATAFINQQAKESSKVKDQESMKLKDQEKKATAVDVAAKSTNVHDANPATTAPKHHFEPLQKEIPQRSPIKKKRVIYAEKDTGSISSIESVSLSNAPEDNSFSLRKAGFFFPSGTRNSERDENEFHIKPKFNTLVRPTPAEKASQAPKQESSKKGANPERKGSLFGGSFLKRYDKKRSSSSAKDEDEHLPFSHSGSAGQKFMHQQSMSRQIIEKELAKRGYGSQRNSTSTKGSRSSSKSSLKSAESLKSHSSSSGKLSRSDKLHRSDSFKSSFKSGGSESANIRIEKDRFNLLKRLANFVSENQFILDDDHLIYIRTIKHRAAVEIPEPIISNIKLEVFPILLDTLKQYKLDLGNKHPLTTELEAKIREMKREISNFAVRFSK